MYNASDAGASIVSASSCLKAHLNFTCETDGGEPSINKRTDMYDPQLDEAQRNGDTTLRQLAKETHIFELNNEIGFDSSTITLGQAEKMIEKTSDAVFGAHKNNNSSKTGGIRESKKIPDSGMTLINSIDSHFYIQGANLGVCKEKGRTKNKLADDGEPRERGVRKKGSGRPKEIKETEKCKKKHKSENIPAESKEERKRRKTGGCPKESKDTRSDR